MHICKTSIVCVIVSYTHSVCLRPTFICLLCQYCVTSSKFLLEMNVCNVGEVIDKHSSPGILLNRRIPFYLGYESGYTGDSTWSIYTQSPGCVTCRLVPILFTGDFVRHARHIANPNIQDAHLGSRHLINYFGSCPVLAMFCIVVNVRCPCLQCK
jgi:hypothetical protein